MRAFYFVTIHPQLIVAYSHFGTFKAAGGKIHIEAMNLRDFAVDRHGTVDDKPYGGGEGAVLRIEPIVHAIRSLRVPVKVILPSPQGKKWNYQTAQRFAIADKSLLFICGRFRGVDHRVAENFVDASYSVGDFVLSGGELAALTMADTILRFVPGVLGNQASVVNDGFDNDQRYAPLYTRPQEFEGLQVPEVLLSGDHQAIDAWREKIIARRKQQVTG